MDANDKAALRLLAETQRLNGADQHANTNPDQPGAVRVTIRTATGEYIGEALLTACAADAFADAAGTVADYAEAMPADYQAGRTAPTPADGTNIDPRLEAELEEHCIGLDTDYLMTMAAHDPLQAVAEFDDITTDGDGGL